jgi:hypothetical protein
MTIFGCPDCANAGGTTKAQALSTKTRIHFLKIHRHLEKNGASVRAVARPEFWKSRDTLEKS